MKRSLSHTPAAPDDAARIAQPGDCPLRVLIVRIGALGDVLHAMPAVAALRQRHPQCVIGWAIEPRWSELLQSAEDTQRNGSFAARSPAKPLVDAWFPLPTRSWREHPLAASTRAGIRATRQQLRAWQFDLCVDMQGSMKSAVTGRMAGAKIFVGPAQPREKQAAWLYPRKIPVHSQHVVEQACELLGAAAGETLRPAKVPLPADQAAELWCDATLADVARPFVLLAPAAGWGAKQWPAKRFGAVAAELARAGFSSIVNAASFGDAVALRVVEASGDTARLIPCSIGQMIALMRRAALVIAGDTGPLHLAAALERPVVALFGPTDPARNGPFATRAVILRHPSSRHSHKRTPRTESGLMQITVAEVVTAALTLLQETPAASSTPSAGTAPDTRTG